MSEDQPLSTDKLTLEFTPQELRVMLGFFNHAINKGGLTLGDATLIVPVAYLINQALPKKEVKEEEKENAG